MKSNATNQSSGSKPLTRKLPPDPSSTLLPLSKTSSPKCSSPATTPLSGANNLPPTDTDDCSIPDESLSETTLQSLIPAFRTTHIWSSSSQSVPKGRVLQKLHHRLQEDTKRFYQEFKEQKNLYATTQSNTNDDDHEPITTIEELVSFASSNGESIYTSTMNELIKHLHRENPVAASLLADLWKGHIALTDQLRLLLLQEYKHQQARADSSAFMNTLAFTSRMDKANINASEAEQQQGSTLLSNTPLLSSPMSFNQQYQQQQQQMMMQRRSSSILPPPKSLLQGMDSSTGSLKGRQKRNSSIAPVAGPFQALHEELDTLRQQNGTLKAALEAAAAEMNTLTTTNKDLQEQLQAAEIKVDEAVHQAEALAAASLTPRPNRAVYDDEVLAVVEGSVEKAGQLADVVRLCSDVDPEVLAGFLLLAVAADSSDDDGSSNKDQSWKTVAAQYRGMLVPPKPTATTIVGVEPTAAMTPPPATTALAAVTEEDVANTPDSSAANESPIASPTTTTTAPVIQQQAQQPPTITTVTAAIQSLKLSSVDYYSQLHNNYKSLKAQNLSLSSFVDAEKSARAKAEAARKKREEEAALERKTPLQEYVDLLSSQGEEAWKESFIGMGMAAEVPKLFRFAGKIRNKHMSKRDTEKLLKELWKERLSDPAVAAGRSSELVDFLGSQLQKRVGVAAAVLELGYNFLYGLWLYKWDADCELFLKILLGETPEDVYIAQVRLQTELEDLFSVLEKSSGGTGQVAAGTLRKEELRLALFAFWNVGQPGGKTLQRFDEAMQALDEDQPDEVVEWKKIFEEDREFNQGEFAEAIRDQFLKERTDMFVAVETSLYELSGQQPDCTKEHLLQALLLNNPTLSEKEAKKIAGAVFPPGIEELGIKTVLKKISRGAGRMNAGMGNDNKRSSGSLGTGKSGSRASTAVAAGKGKASLAGTSVSGVKPAASKITDNISRALEAVRKEWIRAQLEGANQPS